MAPIIIPQTFTISFGALLPPTSCRARNLTTEVSGIFNLTGRNRVARENSRPQLPSRCVCLARSGQSKLRLLRRKVLIVITNISRIKFQRAADCCVASSRADMNTSVSIQTIFTGVSLYLISSRNLFLCILSCHLS